MSATVPPDLLAALVPDAAVLVDDGDGLVRGFNTGAAQLFGPGLQPGRAMYTLIGPEHRKALQALLAEPPADEQTQTVARRLPLRLETGAPAGLSPRAMLRVGLRHAGLRLWQFEELGRPERQQADWLLARFMRLSPGAPFALELDGTPARLRFTIISPGLCRAFGRDEHELAAPDFRVLPHVHAQDRDALAQAMREAALHLTDFHHEFRLMHPLRGPVWHEARATVEIDATGRPGAYGYLLDISARKRAEQQLEAMHAGLEQRVRERTAELEAKHREMERFTYSVSHDLKAPLRGIDGYSRMLQLVHGDLLDDGARDLVARIRHGAGQMNQLIHDLLAYCHLEQRQVRCTRVDLVDLARRAIEARRADDPGLGSGPGLERVLQLEAPDTPVMACADADGLAMVLRNLIDNALKFSARSQPPCVRLRVSHGEDGCAMLSVHDNGIGFDMQYHDRIFEIFQRLERAEAYPGTGIGLAIVRKAMQRMGGRVWAQGEPGRGAVFHLEMPQ